MDESEFDTPENSDLETVKDLDRAQYDIGFQCCSDGEPFDAKRSPAWQLGWHARNRDN